MGRKVKVRDSYLGEVMAISRIRDAARIDPIVSRENLVEIERHAAGLIDVLMSVESERTKRNVIARAKKAG